MDPEEAIVMAKGYLILEPGEVFEGELMGKVGSGEVVFDTSMTGYQDVVRDPEVANRIVVFSYPVVKVDAWEEYSSDIQVSGMVVSELIEKEDGWVKRMGDIPLLTDVDTRALVKCIGKYRSVKGTISANNPYAIVADYA